MSNDEALKIKTYEEAAAVIHLYLRDFCDESLPFPAMIADAVRKAEAHIKELEKDLFKVSSPAYEKMSSPDKLKFLRDNFGTKLE